MTRDDRWHKWLENRGSHRIVFDKPIPKPSEIGNVEHILEARIASNKGCRENKG